jgi:hypothetical protein
MRSIVFASTLLSSLVVAACSSGVAPSDPAAPEQVGATTSALGATATFTPGTRVLLTEQGHCDQLVAGLNYDGHVYDQPSGPTNANAVWLVGSGADGSIQLSDTLHGSFLVGPQYTYDGHVYEQSPSDGDADWQVVSTGQNDGSVYLMSAKWGGDALVAGDTWDNNVYLQAPGGRRNAQWVPIPLPAASGVAEFKPGARLMLTEMGHCDQMVAGDVYDNHVYDQPAGGRANGVWIVNETVDGYITLMDSLHEKYLVGPQSYDGNVYEQDPNGDDAEWSVVDSGYGDGSVYIVSKHWGYSVVAGDTYDNNLYLQAPNGRSNARWIPIPQQ